MKLRKSRIQRKGRIEIIPMIDVMFFLLATFMLASLSMQNLDALKVDLPQGSSARLTESNPLTLVVTADNHLLLNRQPVALGQLTSLVHQHLGADRSLVVSSDSHAQHGTVVQAMLAAQQAGVEHFLIAVSHDGQ